MKAIDAEREKKLLSHGSHKISSVSLSLCRIFGAIERIERRNYHQPRTSGADTTRKKTNYGKTSPCNMTTWRYGIHDNITVKRIIINRQRSKSKNEIELPIRLRESSGHISSHMWRNNILFKFFSFVDFRFLWTPDYARHERICNKRIHWLRGNRNIACTWHFGLCARWVAMPNGQQPCLSTSH